MIAVPDDTVIELLPEAPLEDTGETPTELPTLANAASGPLGTPRSYPVTANNFVCTVGPCRHYMATLEPFEADAGTRELRETIRICTRVNPSIELPDNGAVFDCTQWEPCSVDHEQLRRRRQGMFPDKTNWHFYPPPKERT